MDHHRRNPHTSDIELSGAGCTTAITPNQLVQSSSENDIWYLS
ncbi:NTP-binding protein [Burkholderia cepacia]|uniref:NTP-binding protein n=5 Tax=Pseudomonadota TaxID=1224 RepID=A0AAX2R9X4_BURCE|nr:NTP-binding protein [Burkholderia cepacia]TES95251.1 NTP-binding protein [Burkholderia cepacia]TEU31274.1 NTP-binding protein [Burkholderia cepacia]TEU32922.1 NTP-binding protein [Burkholderia cepacia]TEU82603.1 NTP-binding protein [Burkholderia cepacia]